MNINLKLTVPVINEDGLEKELKIDSNLFLTPYYSTEEDIIPTFPMFLEEDLPVLRKIIFNASLTVNRLTDKIEQWGLLKEKELFALRRDYVICLATNELAKRLNSENVKAKSQSKTLGDFTVSTSQTNDTTVISKIFTDSSKCVKDIEKLLEEGELANLGRCVESAAESAKAIRTKVYAAHYALQRLFCRNDVNDPPHTLGAILRRWIGNNLHVLDAAGGHPLKHILRVARHQRRLLSVYEDLKARRAF